MKKLSVVLCILCGGTASAFAASGDMTIDFSWIGTDVCAPAPRSPEFVVGNAPPGTDRLRFALTNPAGKAFGGAEVALPARGKIPRGTISFQSPCVGGMYTWTVDALDAEGKPLGTARLTRPFY